MADVGGIATAASRLPIGLLGALGMKTLGRYPEFLSPTYQPTFELWDIYHAAYFSAARVTGLNIDAATIGNNFHTDPGFIVPTSELWYVPAHAYAAYFNPIAATFAVGLMICQGGGASFDPGVRMVTDTKVFTLADYTAAGRPAMSNAEPFFAGPGSQFGWRNALGTAAPAAVAAFCLQAFKMPA